MMRELELRKARGSFEALLSFRHPCVIIAPLSWLAHSSFRPGLSSELCCMFQYLGP